MFWKLVKHLGPSPGPGPGPGLDLGPSPGLGLGPDPGPGPSPSPGRWVLCSDVAVWSGLVQSCWTLMILEFLKTV